MSVHFLLVTASDDDRMRLWANTIPYANWLEARPNPRGEETWSVTVMSEQFGHFLACARQVGATVEEIEGAGEAERYVLRVGQPGTGWQEVRTS